MAGLEWGGLFICIVVFGMAFKAGEPIVLLYGGLSSLVLIAGFMWFMFWF